jgi:serine/threonine-protein kinase
MGEVYRGRDQRLGRVVAIKVLPERLESNRERRERFEREARAASRLNHPHICTLYDVGEQDGLHYLVLEYLEGETLAYRLARGPLLLGEALRYATEMAEALDHAHRNGVVHRDLKPGNVILTRSGAKILDFGLARLWKESPGTVLESQAQTDLRELTGEGVILGTLPYMAPEQLEGKETDARTDLFALGAVLYEMMTGRRPFEGSSQASIIAAILSSEPPSIGAERLVSPVLERVVRKCLAKVPERRWQTARDLADELGWILESGAPEPTVLRRKSRTLVAAAVSGLLFGLAGLGAILWSSSRPNQPRSLVRSVIPIAPADSLVLSPAVTSIAISPDGRRVVFSGSRAGNAQLYMRALDRLEAEPIPGTEDGWNPFFSPDGRWLGFQSDNKTKKVSLTGGAPITVCSVCDGLGTTWASDDTIVLGGGRGGLQGVSASGGDQRPLTGADKERGERSLRFPEVLPGGKAVIFTAGGWEEDTFDEARIEVLSLATGQKKVLVEGGAYARYASSGHLVYARAGSLFAVPFDFTRLEVTGEPVAVLEGVATNPNNGEAQFAISSEGTLVYAPGGPMQVHHRLVWVDREGRIEPVGDITAALNSPRLSPDGERIALLVDGALAHLAVYDVPRGTLTRLTFEENVPGHAVWTPDGKRLTYPWQRSGTMSLFWQSADGSGASEELNQEGLAGSWSPDGKFLAFVRSDASFQEDIWILPFEGDRTPRPLVEERSNQFEAEISPDGEWLAYASDESGRTEIYVREFPGLGQKTQISANGGGSPRWSRDGRELFYVESEDKLMVSEIRTRPILVATKAKIAFEDKERRYLKFGYDVAADGRFVMVDENENWPRQLNLVQNWFEELERLVPVR